MFFAYVQFFAPCSGIYNFKFMPTTECDEIIFTFTVVLC
jgi:hypothetical protein